MVGRNEVSGNVGTEKAWNSAAGRPVPPDPLTATTTVTSGLAMGEARMSMSAAIRTRVSDRRTTSRSAGRDPVLISRTSPTQLS
jgi:hypothetical protein